MRLPNYDKLIDDETWAFIHDTETWYPPEAISFPIEKQRAIYDEMCRAFFRGYPEGVTTEDRTLGGIPCRLYSTGVAGPTVVYFHGGGFVVGGLNSHDDVCAEICKETGYPVISVDYRLAPEHRHPAAYEDALAAASAAIAEGPIVLAGDSAGGNLAAAVAQGLKERTGLLGQVLIYPGLGGDPDRGSYLLHAKAPMLSREDVLYYAKIRYIGDTEPADDPTATPLWAPSFAGLPPTIAFAAECDPLADDAGAYARLVAAEGGKAHSVLEKGLVHGYLRARATVPRARASFARIRDAIRALGEGRWPYGETP